MLKGILYRAWQKRSGKLIVPDVRGDDKVGLVGHVGCYITEYDPWTWKPLRRDYKDLGTNIVVNLGRDDLAYLMEGTTTNRFVTNAKWSDGGHDTGNPETPLAVSVTDTDLSNADLEVDTATILGTGNENFDVTVGVDDTISIDTGNAGVENITLTAGTARTASQVVVDINAATSNNLLAIAEANSIRLVDNSRNGVSEIDVQAANANALLGFTVATTTGIFNKTVVAAHPSLRVVRFDVTLTSGANAFLADLHVDPQGISEMGLFTGDDGFYAHKNFGLITKTSSISIDWEWSIDFSLQS